MRDQQGQKRNENVRFRNRETEFFQKGFKVLFGGLLTMKALFVMKRLSPAGDRRGELIVALGFSHAFPRGPFHREPCPWS